MRLRRFEHSKSIAPATRHSRSSGTSTSRRPNNSGSEIERSISEPELFGRLLVEVPLEREWRVAGAIDFECSNRRSRIAYVGGLAIHPDFRGRGLGAEAIQALARLLFAELGYH